MPAGRQSEPAAERTGFRDDPLAEWVRERRHELVWASLVLLQNWIAVGRPRWTGTRLGSYESWCDVIGGTLAAAGIEGFLANREELYRQADSETDDWRAFVLSVGCVWRPAGQGQRTALARPTGSRPSLTLFATARDVATKRSLVIGWVPLSSPAGIGVLAGSSYESSAKMPTQKVPFTAWSRRLNPKPAQRRFRRFRPRFRRGSAARGVHFRFKCGTCGTCGT